MTDAVSRTHGKQTVLVRRTLARRLTLPRTSSTQTRTTTPTEIVATAQRLLPVFTSNKHRP